MLLLDFCAPPRVVVLNEPSIVVRGRLSAPLRYRKNPQSSASPRGPAAFSQGSTLYRQLIIIKMMHSFAARAARAATSKVTARQASNVAVPSSAETQGFARDGVSTARRRRDVARGRRDGTDNGGCHARVEEATRPSTAAFRAGARRRGRHRPAALAPPQGGPARERPLALRRREHAGRRRGPEPLQHARDGDGRHGRRQRRGGAEGC